MKSQLMPSGWCVCPRSQPTATDEAIGSFFEHGPILDAVFLPARDLGAHLLADFLIAERSAKKSHDVRISPKAARQFKVFFYPGSQEQSVGCQDGCS